MMACFRRSSPPPPSFPAIRKEAAILMFPSYSEQASGITARFSPPLMICPGSRNITAMISCRISFAVFFKSREEGAERLMGL